MFKFIKSLFGIHETNHEYWVRLDEIKVPSYFKLTRIGSKKWNHKMGYWLRTGEFESKILLHRNSIDKSLVAYSVWSRIYTLLAQRSVDLEK